MRWQLLLPLGATVMAVLAHSPVEAADSETISVDPGFALRINVLDKSWETRRRFPREQLEFDTLRGSLNVEAGQWRASAQYRFYYYSEAERSTHFLHHAWVGRDLGESSSFRAGVTQVPFGALPYASNSYFLSMAYYLGLEDDYDLGATYRWQRGAWRFDAGYFLGDEGNGFGDSEDSARYSYDIVHTASSANGEGPQGNLRLALDLDSSELGKGEAGLSAQYGRVPNDTTNSDGEHWAFGLHYKASFGRWGLTLETLGYQIDPDNPPGQDDRNIAMGAFDYPYQVAAEGQIHSVALSYHLPIEGKNLQGITFYNDYSLLDKADFDSISQHNVTGAALDFKGPLYVHADLATGRNNAWIGPDFNNGLAGGGDDDWHYRINFNIGLYF